MPDTVEIVGRMVYKTVAIPDRYRNPQIVYLHAPATYELKTARASDIDSNAVAGTDNVGKSFAYLGYEGRLWEPHGAKRLDLESYANSLRDGVASSVNGSSDDVVLSDPIIHAASEPNRMLGARMPQILAQEDFKGRILDSDLPEAHERHQRAAADLLVVDGEVLRAAVEPMWTFCKDTIFLQRMKPGTSPASWYLPRPHSNSFNSFDLYDAWTSFPYDGLETARMWAEREGCRRPRIVGQLHRENPGYAPVPMARILHSCLEALTGTMAECKNRLTDQEFAIWERLRHVAGTIRPHHLGALEQAPAQLLTDAFAAVQNLDRPLRSGLMNPPVRVMINHDALLMRMEIERGLRGLTDMEADALVALAT